MFHLKVKERALLIGKFKVFAHLSFCEEQRSDEDAYGALVD
jgi:hypothetical protein